MCADKCVDMGVEKCVDMRCDPPDRTIYPATHSYGLYSYGLYGHGIYSYGLYSHQPHCGYCADLCIDTYIGMCILESSAGQCTGMCTDMCLDTCGGIIHTQGHN